MPYLTGSDGCASAPGRQWPGPDDLGTLLEAVARGEHGAFDLVYDQLAALVHGVIRAVLRDRAQTEEVAQEVLLEIWQLASRYDPGKGTAAAWARTIAHRRAIDRVRSAAAATARERRIAAAPFLDQPSHAAGDTADYEQLCACLEKLSDRRREAILLAFYDGYSYSQVAAKLGIPLGTAKARIRDGLIKLRDDMQAAGALDPSSGEAQSYQRVLPPRLSSILPRPARGPG